MTRAKLSRAQRDQVLTWVTTLDGLLSRYHATVDDAITNAAAGDYSTPDGVFLTNQLAMRRDDINHHLDALRSVALGEAETTAARTESASEH